MIGNNDRFMSGMMSGFMSKMQAAFDKMGDMAQSMTYAVEPVLPTVQIAAPDDFLSSIAANIHGFWHEMTGDLAATFGNLKEKISSTVGSVVNNVKDSVNGVFERVKESFGSVVNNVKERFSAIKEKIGNTIGNVVNNVKDSVSGVFERVKETFGNVRERIANVKERFGNVVNNIRESVGGVFERVKETFGNVQEKIGGAIASIPAAGLAMGMNVMPVQAMDATQLHMEPPQMVSTRTENTTSENRTGARFEKFCDYVEINLPQGTAGEQAELLLNELMRRINDAVE